MSDRSLTETTDDPIELPMSLEETINEENSKSSTTDGSGSTDDAEIKIPTFLAQHIFRKLNFQTEDDQRYSIGDTLGKGSGGAVFEILDHNLDRAIAVKFLSKKHSGNEEKIRKFIHEALITSRLDHPNILPIYDLEYSDDKQVYYSMKKVDGIPLTKLTEIDSTSKRINYSNLDSEHSDVGEIVNIFIKVCETIAYAHSRGIIHRDIKPDNVMLGAYGEVRVVDWGIATDANEEILHDGKMAGTPVYMSPEQARRLAADESSDIYCIGTTLFHVLFKRTPVDTGDINSFWEAKKKGNIVELNESEKNRIPPPLYAILMKCLEPKAQDRYNSAQELIDELKTFLIGGIVHAHHYSFTEFVKQWAIKNKSNFKWIALIIIIIAGAAWFMYQQQLREYAGWGEPIYVENFDANSNWEDDWLIVDNSFTVKDNQFVTQNGPGCYAFYKYPINGGVRVDFVGKTIEGFSPGDLTLVYTPDLYDADEYGKPKIAYYMQNGGQGNECSTIVAPDGRLDYHAKSLDVGVEYKISGEIDGKKLRLSLDGELICSYDLPLPLNSGYIGFYGFYDGKSFDNIRIYNRELPEITNIIITGDILFDNELFHKAADRYHKISLMYKGTETGEEAIFKQGLSYFKVNNNEKAYRTWNQIKDSVYQTEITYYRWSELYQNQEYKHLCASIERQFDALESEENATLKVKWSIFLKRAIEKGNTYLLKELMRIRERHFPNDQTFGHEITRGYQLLGEVDKVLTAIPNQGNLVARALSTMGRFEEVVRRFPQHRHTTGWAYVSMGKFDKVINEFADLPTPVLESLIATGQFDRALELYGHNDRSLARILRAQGKHAEMIERFPGKLWGENSALLATGQLERYLSLFDDDPGNIEANACIHLSRYLKGKQSALEDLRDYMDNLNAYKMINRSQMFSTSFLVPILDHLNGKPDNLKEYLTTIWQEKRPMQEMRLWNNASLLLGEITVEEFKKQPLQLFLKRDLYLYYAVHHDLYGDRKQAVDNYHQYQSLPSHLTHDLWSIKIFVKSRLEALE